MMPEIEDLLAKGGTAPNDFTLHDENHGHRVADRIADVAGGALKNLSSSELALLLLSAYLHDIGMTPARDIVNRHRKYLMFGAAAPLSNEETVQLQLWLDETTPGVTPPLLVDLADTDALDRIDLLLTHYCRYRHNDWSEQWIYEHLAPLDRQLYPGYLADLAQLCRSHHEGYEDLIEPRFDPRYVHCAGLTEVVHLRYLAALLRIADILDFDPERTPDIVFRHRGISYGSTIYWHKDHDAVLSRTKNVITFSGRPASAPIFHALQTMADEIDHELEVCWKLDYEGRFSMSPLSPDRGLRAWTLTQQLKRDIQPRHRSFEVFDGRFRPKTKRLIELLSGTQLYGTTLASVRELVQNAFDAVRERIAYQRLAILDGGLPDDLASVTSSHYVALSVHTEPSGKWVLDCRDTGMGMNQRTIRDRFLATGARQGHREMDLERRCRAHGFTVGRTGQFGIGAISYFMIAKSLHISTRRSQGAGDDEAQTWEFEIHDLDDFGELRRATSPQAGTCVTLKLRQELTSNARSWFEDLCRYLKKTITYAPCALTLRFQDDEAAIDWKPGWTLTPTDLRESIVCDLAPHTTRGGQPPIDRLSTARQQQIADEHSEIELLRTELRGAIEMVSEEGELPDAMGRYRVHLPFFNLKDGQSVLYVRTREVKGRTLLSPVLKYSYLMPRKSRSISWNGVAVEVGNFSHRFSTGQNQPAPFLEIDWTTADVAELAVNRTKVLLGPRAEKAIDFLFDRAASLSQEWVNNHETSAFTALNSRALRVAPPLSAASFWTFWSKDDSAYEFRRVRFPLIDLDQIGVKLPPSAVWRGVEVEGIATFGQPASTVGSDVVGWSSVFDTPTHVVPFSFSYQQSSDPFLVALWIADGSPTSYGTLPPQWSEVAAAILHPRAAGRQIEIWNKDHSLALAVTNEAWEWCAKNLDPYGDPRAHRDKILSDQAYSAAWLMRIASRHSEPMWNGLAESDASFIRDVWALAFGDDSRVSSPLVVARSVGGWLELSVITPTKWEELKYPGDDTTRANEILPYPGMEWSIHIEKFELNDEA